MSKESTENKKGILSGSNLLTGAILVLLISMIVFPAVKAKFISGLMTIGLFRPTVPADDAAIAGGQLSTQANIEFINERDSSFTLASLKGRVVFINFWAGWCAPCLAELPGIESLHGKMDSAVSFLLVDADGNIPAAVDLMHKHQWHLPVFKGMGEWPPSLYSGTLPTTFVLNKKGEIVFRHEGVANYNTRTFEAFLSRLNRE